MPDDKLLETLLQREAQSGKEVYEPLSRATSIGPDKEAEMRNLVEGMGVSGITKIGPMALRRGTDLVRHANPVVDKLMQIFDDLLDAGYATRTPSARKKVTSQLDHVYNAMVGEGAAAAPEELAKLRQIPQVYLGLSRPGKQQMISSAENVATALNPVRKITEGNKQASEAITSLMELGYIPTSKEVSRIMSVPGGDMFFANLKRTFRPTAGTAAENKTLFSTLDSPEFIQKFRAKVPLTPSGLKRGRTIPMTVEEESAKNKVYYMKRRKK